MKQFCKKKVTKRQSRRAKIEERREYACCPTLIVAWVCWKKKEKSEKISVVGLLSTFALRTAEAKNTREEVCSVSRSAGSCEIRSVLVCGWRGHVVCCENILEIVVCRNKTREILHQESSRRKEDPT